ncbi:403_t:CDS:2 [Dentiscutata erythropus]|uniref:403_t:CDS:1 n=1 Tax=Dentiscutata erythropus TaxID=1348616 RepID=A0A9N9GW55_9GLOM|nr:403_t:CDS:2 [Dentiscutata erythropus]
MSLVADATEEKNNNTTVNAEENEVADADVDEDKLYDSTRPITQRIEIAVQKYRKNRKFSPTRNQVFSSYLRFGGINTGQKSYLGQDGLNCEDADADEIAARRAVDFIEENDDELEVDFAYTVRVYLSSYFVDKSGYVQMDQFREAPLVVISFLNYLIKHDVCPEYLSDMQEALKIAECAKYELPNCKLFAQLAPGKFNKACSLIFGGELYGMFENPWFGEESVAKMIGISQNAADETVKKVFGQNVLSELKQVLEASKKALFVEVIDIEPIPNPVTPDRTINEASSTTESITANNTNMTENVTVDTNVAECTKNGQDSLNDEYLQKMSVRAYQGPDADIITVYLEPSVARCVTLGMLITADFHQLTNGWWYFDRVTNVYPSYYLEGEESSDEDE